MTERQVQERIDLGNLLIGMMEQTHTLLSERGILIMENRQISYERTLHEVSDNKLPVKTLQYLINIEKNVQGVVNKKGIPI